MNCQKCGHPLRDGEPDCPHLGGADLKLWYRYRPVPPHERERIANYPPHPMFSPYVQRAFDLFACVESAESGHPLDDRRFHRFVKVAHLRRSKATDGDVREALLQAGFAEENASFYASIYHHGREILALRHEIIRRDPVRGDGEAAQEVAE